MLPKSGRSTAAWLPHRSWTWGGRRRRPAISEILSVLMLTVALAVGTAVLVFAYMDQQGVREEAVRSHTDLSSMRASELVTWSSAHCTSDGRLDFMLHNYGAENLSTADVRAYGSWSGRTEQLNRSTVSFSTLSNRDVTGLDVRSGETVWASIGLGCDATPVHDFDWDCGNPAFRNPNYFSCGQTKVSLVTPAEDVVRIDHDDWETAPQFPPRSGIVSCTLGSTNSDPTTLCFDMSAQPLPVTAIEVWNMGRGGFRNNNAQLVANVTGSGITTSADGGTACIEAPTGDLKQKTLRFRNHNDEGGSTFGQRPWIFIFDRDGNGIFECGVRNYEIPGFRSCSDGRMNPPNEC